MLDASGNHVMEVDEVTGEVHSCRCAVCWAKREADLLIFNRKQAEMLEAQMEANKKAREEAIRRDKESKICSWCGNSRPCGSDDLHRFLAGVSPNIGE